MCKKWTSALLGIVLVVCCAALLTACETKHSHTFADVWTTDESCHWLVCTAADCHEVNQMQAHSFDGRLCTVCDYMARRIIRSVNHRGYADAPENTLSAFRLSKEMGFSVVECDVGFTSDNVPVLLHDSDVGRTSNGSGALCNMTFEQVRALDFGSWKSERYAGETIPTLTEFLDLCTQLELQPYIEIKDVLDDQQVEILVNIADSYQLEITWISFHSGVLTKIQEYRSRRADRFGLLGMYSSEHVDILCQWRSDGIDAFYDCKYSTLTAEGLEYCIQAQVPLEVWTVEDIQTILEMDEYISGVTSDTRNAQSLFDLQMS